MNPEANPNLPEMSNELSDKVKRRDVFSIITSTPDYFRGAVRLPIDIEFEDDTGNLPAPLHSLRSRAIDFLRHGQGDYIERQSMVAFLERARGKRIQLTVSLEVLEDDDE